MTAFIGVRISWLILARNRDLALVADSARSLANSRSSSTFFLSVRSMDTLAKPI